MLDELVPYKERIKDPEALFNHMYRGQPEFDDFPWDLERYKARFSRIQTVVRRMKWSADKDKDALAEARAMYGEPTHYPNGKPVWRGSEAAKQLDADLVAGLLDDMEPSEVFDMHECYKPFGLKRLGQRLDYFREKAKPYGENPQQAAANRAKRAKQEQRKVKPRPNISRKGSVGPYEN